MIKKGGTRLNTGACLAGNYLEKKNTRVMLWKRFAIHFIQNGRMWAYYRRCKEEAGHP